MSKEIRHIHLVLTGLTQNESDKDSGGIQLAEISFAECLGQTNQKPITIYAGSSTDTHQSKKTPVKMKLLGLGKFQPGGIANSFLFSLKAAAEIIRETFNHPGSIAHFTSLGPAMIYFSDMTNYLSQKNYGPQTVYTLHNFHYAIADQPLDIFERYPEEWSFLHDQEKKVISRADKVWVTNNLLSELLNSKFGRTTRYVPNTIGPLSVHHKEKINTGYCTFFSICRMAPEKNIPNIIRAFSMVSAKNKKIRLLIAGSGEEKEKVLSLIQSSNLPYRLEINSENLDNIPALLKDAKIVFLGETRKENKRKMWQMADALILPSLREVAPLVGLEALFYGKPIIGSKIPGWEYYSHLGAPIILVDPLSPESIAQAIDELAYKILKEGSELSNQAHATYLNHFSPEVVVPQRMKAYEE